MKKRAKTRANSSFVLYCDKKGLVRKCKTFFFFQLTGRPIRIKGFAIKSESGLKSLFVAKLFVVKNFLILINNKLTPVKKFFPPRF